MAPSGKDPNRTKGGWLRPPRLRPGDRVAVVAPSGAVLNRSALVQGMRELRRWGLEVVYDEGIFERHLFLAGTDERRREEWHAAWTNPDIHAVFAARGGSGSYRLLPLPDLAFAQGRPRVFCGFSDLTFVHAALSREKLVSFYGPLVAWDLARGDEAPRGYDGALFKRLMVDGEPGGVIEPTGGACLRGGVVEGPLAGGCLCLLSALVGTPEMPDFRDTILVIEDENEPPYRLDRYLYHLRRAGAFEGVRGVMLGEFPDCNPVPPDTTTVRQVLEEFFADFPGPVVWGFPVGHTSRPSLTIPLGVWARLDCGTCSLEMLEPAVT